METNHVKLPQVVDGFASEGIIQFFFEESGDDAGFNIYILDETNRAEVYHHCEGSKEELKEELDNPFTGKAIHHLRQLDVVGLHLNRQAMQFVVGNRAVKLNL